jgi:hypothetical protein
MQGGAFALVGLYNEKKMLFVDKMAVGVGKNMAWITFHCRIRVE